ncbi:hypothetical protein [Pelagibacterium montanilacus]|uniref:hypothetical protein n=1 Tax=Pelagibacterium montanilacus TaxID=2185280 RepID=UPI000F8E4CA0|nr:hypothetical protein [Pelagibacterium montanilacus]
MIDIDCFVFARRERNWLGSSLYSVERSAALAIGDGHNVRLTLILWNADPATKCWASERVMSPWIVIGLPASTLAEARNVARQQARGRAVLFLDGTDMIGESWLIDTVDMVSQRSFVVRPEALVTFGADPFLPDGFECILQHSHTREDIILRRQNPLPSGFVTSRDVIQSVPWPDEDRDRAWGDVDWWWNCLAATGDDTHRIARNTAHFRRVDDKIGVLRGQLMRPGPVYRPPI